MYMYLTHVLACRVRSYVFECPTCGIIFKSREYWLFNQDSTEVRTETVHVWPLVCSSALLLSSLLLASYFSGAAWQRRLIAELLVA